MPAKSSPKNLPDQIDELKRKIQLVDGERQAYHEAAKESIQKNKDRIFELRKENDDIRKDNADKLAADEKVVKAGLKQNPEESRALRWKPGDVAVVAMDEKVLDREKALNALRHVTRKKQEKLDSLIKRQQQQKNSGNKSGSKRNERARDSEDDDSNEDDDDDDVAASRSSTKDDDEDESATAKRNIENSLDKSNLKCKEAEHIRRTYQQIKSKLEDEQQTFEQKLDDLEREIQRMKHQLGELSVMQDDAQLVKNKTKRELEAFEKEVQADRKRRAEELEALKKERQDQDIKQKAKTARLGLNQDALSDQKQILGGSDDEQEQLRKYEILFKKMKQAAGMSDTRELVQRFRDQGDKNRDLNAMLEENEKTLEALTEKKEKLLEEYNEKKYTGEAKIASGELLVSTEERSAAEAEARREGALEDLEKSSKLLTRVKTGVEHLTEKLKSFKKGEEADSAESLTVTPGSEVQLLDQLKICDHKLSLLMNELSSAGQEEAELSKKMDDDEFVATTDLRLPAYNTRVKLPSISRDREYADDNMSGDESEFLTRQALKKKSQQIIDSKTRRRPNKKKKRMGK